MILEPGSRVGDYTIEERLGGGGMARVYRVRHSTQGSLHAMKVLSPHLATEPGVRQRFLEEGRILSRLRHPNIVPVTGTVSDMGVAALVMDFVYGQTLDVWLKSQTGPTDIGDILFLFKQILSALGHAHRRGIIHRDVKPGNIIVQFDEGVPSHVMLVDFGIAKSLDRRDNNRTGTNVHMGTPHYMSPEHVRSARDVDARSDIFSVGVTLYECVTGQRPFEGESDFDIQSAVVAGRFEPPSVLRPDIDPVLEQVIMLAMRRDRDERFQSCEAFSHALSRVGEPPLEAVSEEGDFDPPSIEPPPGPPTDPPMGGDGLLPPGTNPPTEQIPPPATPFGVQPIEIPPMPEVWQPPAEMQMDPLVVAALEEAAEQAAKEQAIAEGRAPPPEGQEKSGGGGLLGLGVWVDAVIALLMLILLWRC